MIELNNIHDGFDREVIQQVLLDMIDGRFYTEMDDATLGISLMAMWENLPHWQDKGIPLGRA